MELKVLKKMVLFFEIKNFLQSCFFFLWSILLVISCVYQDLFTESNQNSNNKCITNHKISLCEYLTELNLESAASWEARWS